jgi:glycerophosphoryl diester phosphodiesterase
VRRLLLLILLTSIVSASCLGGRPTIRRPEVPREVATLTLVGQFSIPSQERFPPVVGLPFGGISGLTAGDEGREIYGISDARLGGRIYRFSLENPGGALRVVTMSGVALAMAPDDTRPDHEGLALLPDGRFAVAAEGTAGEPRLPPSINIYGRHGDFAERLPVPDKFVPEPTGTAARGARGNAGFESLTLSPDGARLFTASETALIQDGEPASFAAGARARIVEYTERNGGYEPGREYAYELEPVQTPAFPPGVFITGLVDLLAVDRTTLLALERGYVSSASDPSQSENRIRLYRISLTGATDVSALESVKGRSEVVPVPKTLLMDLSQVEGLSPELAPSLDNFEGMVFGPRLPDGRASLLLVSDDNFSEAQRTWFLLFAIE